MTEKRHIYGLDQQDLDGVIAFMSKNKDRMSIADKELLITLIEIRHVVRGTEVKQ